ncbi:MAG: hypothetical protein JWP97_1869 [Labilithrix sp.]|nr:hypothetical protein [Labilithrix sp.]
MVYQLSVSNRDSTTTWRVLVLVTALLPCGACRNGTPAGASPLRAPEETVASPPPPSAVASHAASPAPDAGRAAAPARPAKLLTVAEARRYMVQLVNRDRATHHLPPVVLDEGPATIAAQAHADDMAHLGYLGHWGSDGSVPEQRHTGGGGADMVLENALCFTDEKTRTLDPQPLLEPSQVERAESLFFDEVPPNDGHRKNILRPGHTGIGIGVAQPVATPTELAVSCFAQELTDHYGTYAPVPRRAKVGAMVHVQATLAPGLRPTGVGVARAVPPAPLPVAELNKRRSYPVPKPFQLYWGPGYVTPKPVLIEGSTLSIDVPLSDHGQPGLYEISVFAKFPGSDEQTMVGLRTIVVE